MVIHSLSDVCCMPPKNAYSLLMVCCRFEVYFYNCGLNSLSLLQFSCIFFKQPVSAFLCIIITTITVTVIFIAGNDGTRLTVIPPPRRLRQEEFECITGLGHITSSRPVQTAQKVVSIFKCCDSREKKQYLDQREKFSLENRIFILMHFRQHAPQCLLEAIREREGWLAGWDKSSSDG